jgi:sugar phosphate isomerase/epimerase
MKALFVWLALGVGMSVFAVSPVLGAEGEPALKFDNPLACRFASYGKYQEAAWAHLPSIGVKYVFLNVPEEEEVEATMEKLAKHNLTPLVMRGNTNLSQATCVQELGGQLAICERMGVKYLFLSPKRHGAPKEDIYEKLREVGDLAKNHGITVTLETHPDLGTNGAIHLETMKAIHHPNIKVNYDTANITYYNHDTSAVAELEKVVESVGTVELKDHDGKFETWHFPVLGQGVVDFPKILDILKDADYQGPITLEFEGVEGVELDEEQTKQAIADCVKYARSLGGFD